MLCKTEYGTSDQDTNIINHTTVAPRVLLRPTVDCGVTIKVPTGYVESHEEPKWNGPSRAPVRNANSAGLLKAEHCHFNLPKEFTQNHAKIVSHMRGL